MDINYCVLFGFFNNELGIIRKTGFRLKSIKDISDLIDFTISPLILTFFILVLGYVRLSKG